MEHSDEKIICPNCGYQAAENYCAQCGQETHLHDESIWRFIMHFIGDYFHYDSKFWKTIKALWTSPGKLTLAYWNIQRMRYIQPIPLYIFVSIVFFLTTSVLPHRSFLALKPKYETSQQTNGPRFFIVVDTSATSDSKAESAEELANDAAIRKMLSDREHVQEESLHLLPKIFFLLIPVMSGVLSLLFLKRRLGFVKHIIFSLHFHSFYFSAMWLGVLYRFDRGLLICESLLCMISAVYFLLALKRVYKIGLGKAVLYSAIIGLVYMLCLAVAIVILAYFILSRYK